MTESRFLKNIAQQFLTMTATGAVDAAFAEFIDARFIHHNQYFKGDRESLRLAMIDSATSMPGKIIEVKQMVQEGNQVSSYSHVYTEDRALDLAVFHLFKFENGKIIELWDVAQHIVKDGPNEFGLF